MPPAAAACTTPQLLRCGILIIPPSPSPLSRAAHTQDDFDTFGAAASEAARAAAHQEAGQRPSAIPGLVPEELLAPVANSIGA